jgi:2'-5' RNA ligase
MIRGLVSKQSSSNWKTHSLWEYLLLAHPDAAVNEQVLVEKNYFFNEYRQPIAIRTKPHITIANFLAKEEMEQTLLRWIQRVCDNQSRFVTMLNNFSGFPAHTIYLRVQNHQPYKELAKGLKSIEQYVRSNDCPPVHLVSTPHLTIARHLSEEVYEKAIKDFSQRLFHASFSVDNLLLIKRRHQREAFQHVTLFPLAAQPHNLFN